MVEPVEVFLSSGLITMQHLVAVCQTVFGGAETMQDCSCLAIKIFATLGY